MNNTKSITGSFYVGFFIVTLCTLLYQMLLTRIFSVTMWYHFAFVAVSLAMFGMTVGALLVFLFPDLFRGDAIRRQVARSALLFSITMVFCLLTQLAIPFRLAGLVGLYSLAFVYLVSAIPFIASGIVVCLVLTQFPERLNRLYAVDLLGAGVGCLLLIPLLSVLDGPTAVIAVAGLIGISAVFFSQSRSLLRKISIVWSLLCWIFVAWHIPKVRQQKPFLSVMYVKGRPDPPRLYEKWNAFSSIRVHSTTLDPNAIELFEKTYGSKNPPESLTMNIDAAGGTPITAFDGNLSKIEYLKRDAVNLAHHLRPDSHYLVIGTGGGIDILSGLVFHQKKIVGVDINPIIINTVNRRFGDFSGHLDRYPNVSFNHEEGRSFITRSPEKYNIILANLIDTWAAGASGAFALTENSLYTVEAWTEYLKHLRPNGIVTFKRWYYHKFPDEIYRLTNLAVTALKKIGVDHPRNHILVVTPGEFFPNEEWTTGTILISPDPFSDEDLKKVEDLSQKLPFHIKLSPHFAIDSTLSQIAEGKDLAKLYESFPCDISPSTDDKPFFFHRYRLGDVFKLVYQPMDVSWDVNTSGIIVLSVLLVTVVGLVFATILLPLFLKGGFDFSAHRGFVIYFVSIGIAFMMVEISQLQRLSIFLGHPTYSLSVVLFSLLIGSGLGSFCSEIFAADSTSALRGRIPFVLLLLAVLTFGLATPWVIREFTSSPISMRIGISVLMVLPLGFMMGMPFPIGLRRAFQGFSPPVAWFWAINGAVSVCASVLAVAVSISWGISVSYWLGGAFYLLASVVLLWPVKNLPAQGYSP